MAYFGTHILCGHQYDCHATLFFYKPKSTKIHELLYSSKLFGHLPSSQAPLAPPSVRTRSGFSKLFVDLTIVKHALLVQKEVGRDLVATNFEVGRDWSQPIFFGTTAPLKPPFLARPFLACLRRHRGRKRVLGSLAPVDIKTLCTG